MGDSDSSGSVMWEIFNQVDDSEALLWIRQNSPILMPIFALFGIFGNSMALLLIRSNFWLKRLTSNDYLCALSISSCIFLSTLIISWANVSILPLYGESEICCKLFTFLAHFSDFICVWMISWISCDRMIVLYRPGIRKWICTKKFVRKLTIGTVLLSIILYIWVFIFAGLEIEEMENKKTETFCGLSQNASFFGYNISEYYFVFTLMDTAICTLIPAILIIIVNSFSTYRYRQCMKIYSSGVLRVRFLRGPSTDEQTRYQEDTTAKKLLLSTTNNNTNTQNSTQSHRSMTNCGSKLRSSDLQLSRTLLIVTSTFVLLTVPSYCMRIIQYLFSPSSKLFHLVHYLTYLIYYFHHAILFYLYIFYSDRMKKQLKPAAMRLLECYCCKTVPDFGHRSLSLQEFNKN